ncbi:RDD family protein [Hymenobacter sp. BT730]|uniref:RDD family protein n=1 Tax=Hymenobacter sp. BT730 TaxID=3063332 RepID=UPI0026E09C49|nr:RDD family protein [Hymenobacter sp. BT730]
MSTIRVHTTQNVSLEYEVASVGDRIVACIIDNLILFGWIGLLGLGLTLAKINGTTLVIIMVIFAGLPFVFYNLACEVLLNGQSPGKKARNIKVIRLDGARPGIGDYLLRWLLRIVDMGMFSGAVAVMVVLLNGKGQRIGDLAAGTSVVNTSLRRDNPLSPISPIEGYQVVFPQAALLADHDVATLRVLLHKAVARENYMLLNKAANKVKELTGVHTDLQDESFLHTIIRDHAHLAATHG